MAEKKLVYERDDDSLDPDDDLFDTSFLASRCGDMPELLAVVDDKEVLEHLKNPTTVKYLREISLDPSKVESVINTPEMQFLKRKILEQLKKTHPEIDINAV